MSHNSVSLSALVKYALNGLRIKWRSPRKCEVLIFDRVGADTLLEELHEFEVDVIDIRGESLNVHVFTRALVKLFAQKHRLTLGALYIDEYIRASDPRLVITFIDNNPSFYSLSHRHPKIKTAFVQNGVRDALFDLFSYLEPRSEYFVDRMYTFSDAMSAEYRKRIKGKSVAIGSMKNNSSQLKSSGEVGTGTGRVIWISQWIEGFEPDPMFSRHDADCVRSVFQWCKKHNLELAVLGRDRVRRLDELAFYRHAIGSDDFSFLPGGKADVYAEVDASDLIVTVDSTLGYEALARGRRVAFLGYRKSVYTNDSLNFGWPSLREPVGTVWTSSASEADWVALLSRVWSYSPSDWEKLTHGFHELMVWDSGNQIFKKDIFELLMKVETNG
jgi:surface carbohydrate biosynthesis protein